MTPTAVEEPTRKRLAEAAAAPEVKQKKVTKDKQATESSGSGNKKKRKKKVIDYSATQAENETGGAAGVGVSATVGTGSGGVADNADPKSKVRSWLLASQCRVEPPTSALSKSKSTPVGLTTPAGAPPRPSGGRVKHVTLRRLTDPKSRSLGSLAKNDTKMRLQVVYKPPFKFSVKLRKADKVGQTPGVHGPTRNAGPRTGVLVRTKRDKVRIGQAKQIHAPNKTINACIPEPQNSDLHTVPSDLEVLLSESEFLFSDA